jgi:hypothetical protein
MPDALCWSCERSVFDCLCQWPTERPEGVRTRTVIVKGERLERVVECDKAWIWKIPPGRGQISRK